ncbi:probable WRKY transcription factor 2 [Zingiber officinale]|uniref:probable WRKY transcription factor 2 n=1 Tax=Zingiber officinale TaxID=94328 RepID=UPI001C4C4C3D|nr:probable WRKY transcription factor 2 [Zingiber officinale]
MVEMENDSGMIGSWLPSNPSSRTLLSSSSTEDFGSRSLPAFLVENGNLGLSWNPGNQTVGVSSKTEGEVGANSINCLSPQPKLFGDSKSSSIGGLAQRMATRKGFNVPKLDTANIPSTSTISSLEIPLPYLTIPPGLSPTALFESPALFSDISDQPSPATGKLEFLEYLSSNTMPVSCSAAFAKSEYNIFEDISEALTFKTPLESDSHHSRLLRKLDLPSIEGDVQMGIPTEARKVEAGSKNFQYQPEFCIPSGSSIATDKKNTTNNAILHQQILDVVAVSDEQNGACPKGGLSVALGTPAEDGYNWRKYGQKQVKGSECPRSYYKCTHPKCQMKKKVERSHEGRITEIIYKGFHNHLKPSLNRRVGVPSSSLFNDLQSDGSEQPDSLASFDENPIKGSFQSGNGCQDCLGDGLEATSAASVAAEFCDASNTLQENQDGNHSSPDSIGVSSTMSNDEEDDRETHGSITLGGDGDRDEPESKSRKLDACVVEINAASRTIREPRIVIQAITEIDILDDGFRWRKYGQKVVKGNSNPRSYYKCTNPGCSVRKHIERASHDLKSVITTYEGKHNHEAPTTRRSSHPNSGLSNAASSSATQPLSLLQKHEPIQDRFARFNTHTPLTAFNFPPRDQLGTATGFPFAMEQPSLANLAMAGFNPMAAVKMPISPPLHSFRNHGHPIEVGYMMHKVEPKEEPLPGPLLPVPNSVSVYHQMMSKPTTVVECRSKDGYSFG